MSPYTEQYRDPFQIKHDLGVLKNQVIDLCRDTPDSYPLILAIIQQNHHDVTDAIRNRKQKGLGVNFALANRETPMQLAIDNAPPDNDFIVDKLIKAHFFLNHRNDEDATPIIEQSKRNRNLLFFIAKGANINDMDRHGHTALHYAIGFDCETNCIDIIDMCHDRIDLHLAGLGRGNISAIQLAMKMKGTPGAAYVLKYAYKEGMLDAEDMKELERG